MNEPPLFPAGEFVPPVQLSSEPRGELINQLSLFPGALADAVLGLNDADLDMRYRNWTIRQIVHHIADSHVNCYVRFKWSMTEETPRIKSYDETLWSEVVDAKNAAVESSLVLLAGIHGRWSELLLRMSDADFNRGFFHPETQTVVKLGDALPNYVWHGQHHLAQIKWVKANRIHEV